MSETPGQVLERLHFEMRDREIGNWSRLSRGMYDALAAAFLAEMRCVRFVPSDAAEVELPFDPDDYPVR